MQQLDQFWKQHQVIRNITKIWLCDLKWFETS